ncbi:hypothetical protein OAH08_00830 [Verrucomicrobia bacterium]|nr:hypothetical protein [Verrucomicrobiota bacterium]
MNKIKWENYCASTRPKNSRGLITTATSSTASTATAAAAAAAAETTIAPTAFATFSKENCV